MKPQIQLTCSFLYEEIHIAYVDHDAALVDQSTECSDAIYTSD